MMKLIIGGSGSGKSAYAEDCITSMEQTALSEGNLYYIATMKVYGEEGKQRVAHHRKMREGKGFLTIEQETDLHYCLSDIRHREEALVLIECMSNLVANEMFTETETKREGIVVKKVLEDFAKMSKVVKHLVVVTNNVFEDGCQYDEATKAYIRALGRVNAELAKMADQVVEVVAGIPLEMK